jgi:hypothetical protein
LAWQVGQKPRARQENITSRSSAQSGHLMRATLRPSYMSLANQGKPASGIPAIEVFFDHLLDDRPEISVLPFEFCQ